MELYIHELKLSGDNDFSKRFNYVGWLWKQSQDEAKTEEQREFYSKEHWSAKFCLEQGMPISFLNEYQQ